MQFTQAARSATETAKPATPPFYFVVELLEQLVAQLWQFITCHHVAYLYLQRDAARIGCPQHVAAAVGALRRQVFAYSCAHWFRFGAKVGLWIGGGKGQKKNRYIEWGNGCM